MDFQQTNELDNSDNNDSSKNYYMREFQLKQERLKTISKNDDDTTDELKRGIYQSQMKIKQNNKLTDSVLDQYDMSHIQREKYDNYMLGNIKLREGWIKKKESFGYQKIFVQLTREKIVEYQSYQDTIPSRTICISRFKTQLTVLQIQDQLIIKINFPDLQRSLIYKFEDQIELTQWHKCLQAIIDNSNEQNHVKIQKQEIDRYFYEDFITEKEFLQMVDTGDLLLFETYNIGAKIQRVITKSKYDHVAMVIRLQHNYVSIFDSNADSVLNLIQQQGVSFVEWNTFIDMNDLYQKVVLRKLLNFKIKDIEQDLFKFLHLVHGKKYQVTASKLLKKKSLSPRSKQDKCDDGYFCSELVAKAFKRCKLLESQKASSSFWPVDFTQTNQLKLSNDAQLSKEIIILLDKHKQI